jgi:hypothetical protein
VAPATTTLRTSCAAASRDLRLVRTRAGGRSECDANCDAISADRIEVLARAVVLVAGGGIPQATREAVLARVTAELVDAAE